MKLSMFVPVLVLVFAIQSHANKYLEENKYLPGCGKPNTTLGRIVGGYDVGYFKYPWFAALELKANGNEPACGGALITSRHVLTAAHCFTTFSESKPEDVFRVSLGIYNHCVMEPERRTYQTEKVFVHQLYNQTQPFNDIALIKLDREAREFTPICLPMATTPATTVRASEGTVIGLGLQKPDSDQVSCILREARVLIYSDKKCHDLMVAGGENANNIANVFCAGYLQGEIDSCQGDSGGPMDVMGANGQRILAGIVSFGYGCAEKNQLGFYTEVSRFIPWIVYNVEESTILSESTTPISTKKPPRKYPNNNYYYPPWYYYPYFYYYYYYPPPTY